MNQKEGESFEHFLTDIKHLVKSCNYNTIDPDGTVEEKALRDKIVMGIRDTVTREALLRVDKLKLNKAIDICRASEMSKNQNKMFSEESAEVNTATKRHVKRKGSKQNDTKAQEKFKCKRCLSMHGSQECPAFGKPCTKCGILNQFAIACRVRNIKNVQQNVNSDSEDSCSSLFVNHVNFLGSSKDLWDEIVEIEDTKFKVKLDTGADVSVIPRKIFDKIDKQFKILVCSTQLEISGETTVFQRSARGTTNEWLVERWVTRICPPSWWQSVDAITRCRRSFPEQKSKEPCSV
ncbi:uncharacterized protein LOC116175529 [Photinus pyralis]|uniref:uncharacterized protein LOC116175529 n=1 Tax=Photinus pyralis TaxID=7054 RepID=UPI0012675026|nr:uncharacterized protein LOC116175529 [Photinus pyralis]